MDGSVPTTRTLLRHPFAWSLALLGGLLAALMTFSYLYGFLEPTLRLQKLPIGIVNLDRSAPFGNEQIDAGRQVLHDVTHSPSNSRQQIRWRVMDSRAELVRAIKNFDVYGGFIVPASFSKDVVALGTSFGHAPPARLDVLGSSGTGTFGAAVFDRVRLEVVTDTSQEVRRQLIERLAAVGVKLDPDAAISLGEPVHQHFRDVVPITEHSGRGLAPFYFALMMTLAGFAATTAISIGIDVLAGHEEFDVLGRIIRFSDRDISESARWRAKASVALTMAPIAAALETVVAVDLLGMSTSSWVKTFLFAWLGIATIAALSLVFLTAFGIIGELVSVIFITIFGVPSALGVFPQYALPGFFRFTSSWHPMRYETDGARAILFFHGRGAVGLDTALVVLAAWLVGSVLIGSTVAAVVDHFRSHDPRVFRA